MRANRIDSVGEILVRARAEVSLCGSDGDPYHGLAMFLLEQKVLDYEFFVHGVHRTHQHSLCLNGHFFLNMANADLKPVTEVTAQALVGMPLAVG